MRISRKILNHSESETAISCAGALAVQVPAELSPRFDTAPASDPDAYRSALAAGADTSGLSALWARIDR